MAQQDNAALYLEFEDNRLLSLLFGDQDKYLKRIEQGMNVAIHARGNQVAISGDKVATAAAKTALLRLYDRLKKGLVVSISEVDASIRIALAPPKEISQTPLATKDQNFADDLALPTRKIVVTPRTEGQRKYVRCLKENELVFSVGPAGTGKTYLAVAMGVSMLLSGQIERIILSRPAVEAGEQLGFLPGDLREKVDPYLRPLYDALHDMIPSEQVERRIQSGEIEIAPLAFMRGRTLSNAFIILDEAQNTIRSQMKMFLTRLGNGSRMVITGDLTQVDLPHGVESGLQNAISLLGKVKNVGVCYLEKGDVVRHPLVRDIIEAYEHEK